LSIWADFLDGRDKSITGCAAQSATTVRETWVSMRLKVLEHRVAASARR